MNSLIIPENTNFVLSFYRKFFLSAQHYKVLPRMDFSVVHSISMLWVFHYLMQNEHAITRKTENQVYTLQLKPVHKCKMLEVKCVL